MFQTYQTKLKNMFIPTSNGMMIDTYQYFEETASYLGSIERKLFVDLYVRNKDANPTKVLYCAKYNLTARQYNSIKNQLDGRVKTCKESRTFHINEMQEKIKKLEHTISKKIESKEKEHQSLLKMNGKETHFVKKVRSYRKRKRTIHQKKRKLHRLELKLKQLKEDEQNKTIRICFGSKELFQKQFQLEANNLTFTEWKKEWRSRRASQFTFLGSKDESFGNLTCTYDTNNNLRIRNNKNLETIYGPYVTIPDITFPYGQEQIDAAKQKIKGLTKGNKEKNYYRALTHKFIKKDNVWHLTTTVDVDMPDSISIQGNGVIGIDYNVGFLAVTETDRFGNVIHSFTVPFKGYNVSSEQAKQSISEALQIVVNYAIEKQKPIAYEDLDFKKKKSTLKEMSKKQARMLSGLGYRAYQELLESKCKKTGIQTIPVFPDYTSQIGHAKFMKRYGLGSHNSAALIIARRGLGCSVEKVPYGCPIGYPKKFTRAKERKQQWASLTKFWKKHTFEQKLYILNKLG